MQCYSYHSFQAKMLCATNVLLHVCHASGINKGQKLDGRFLEDGTFYG